MAIDRTRKRREQRQRKLEREVALLWWESLPDDVVNKLCSIDHPKIEGAEHSMYSYVWWLCDHRYLQKAKEVVIAHTS